MNKTTSKIGQESCSNTVMDLDIKDLKKIQSLTKALISTLEDRTLQSVNSTRWKNTTKSSQKPLMSL